MQYQLLTCLLGVCTLNLAYAAQCVFPAHSGCAGMTDSRAHAQDDIIPPPANQEAEKTAPRIS